MILEGFEFETIWCVAHKWGNQNPNTSTSETMNQFVKERLLRITRATMHQKLSLRRSNNMPVLDGWLFMNMILDWKVFWAFRNTYFFHKFDKELLDSLYVSRAEVLKWCDEQYLAFPQFWLDDNQFSKIPEKTKDTNASKRDKAEFAWRAIAELIWMIDPNIYPVHIAKSKAIRQIDNIQDYTPETVRDWIADLDPQKETRNTGAPRKIEYKIDLESGVINEKAFPSYTEK